MGENIITRIRVSTHYLFYIQLPVYVRKVRGKIERQNRPPTISNFHNTKSKTKLRKLHGTVPSIYHSSKVYGWIVITDYTLRHLCWHSLNPHRTLLSETSRNIISVDICWKAVPGNSNNNTKEMSTSLPWRYYLVFILYSLFCSAQRYSHMNAQMKLFIEVSSAAGIDFKPVFRRLTRAAPLRHSLQAPSSVHPAENTHGRLQWCWWTDRWGCKYTLLIVPTLKTRGMWQTIVTETSD